MVKKTGRPVRVAGEKSTKDKIFDASVDLFSEQGYDRTSVRDIARAVGIAESAVYRHYPSKEAILEAIFSYMETRIYTPLPPPRTGESTIFRDMLEGLPKYIMSDIRLVKISHIMFAEMYHNTKIRDRIELEYGERADAYTEALFRQQMEDGKIRRCDPKALAKVFNGFRFSWLFQTFIVDCDRPLDIDRVESELQDQIKLLEDLLRPEERRS